MSSEEEANHAIEVLDGTEFAGNVINVEISHGGKDKRPRDDNRRILPRKSYGRTDERDSREGYRSSRYEERYSNNDRSRHREAPHNHLEMLSGRPDLPIAASMLAATLLNPNTLSLLQNMANIRNLGNREENGNRDERRYSRRSPPRTERYSSSRYQTHERRHRSRSDRSPDRSYSRRH